MEFFDTTPIGRIINRFSKDLEATENKIPESYKSVVRCLLVLLSAIAIISISTPWFLLTFIPLALIYYFIQVNFDSMFVLIFELILLYLETIHVIIKTIKTP
jgi:ABC-type multidrug transport system fused ATPase/permease subunit